VEAGQARILTHAMDLERDRLPGHTSTALPSGILLVEDVDRVWRPSLCVRFVNAALYFCSHPVSGGRDTHRVRLIAAHHPVAFDGMTSKFHQSLKSS
jgi:hypothetical protein